MTSQSHYDPDDLLPLSLIQHLLFCERRAALIAIDAAWEDNEFTARGSYLHQRVDTEETEVRGPLRVARGLHLASLRLGLAGRADAVEFHASPPGGGGCRLPGAQGLWLPFPVEYKSGRLREEAGYDAQLCAQGLCLEEMLGVAVPRGAVYYGKTRRRWDVAFDDRLREGVEVAARRLHELVRAGELPPALYGNKCASCSLEGGCMPRVVGGRASVGAYLRSQCERATREDGDGG